MQLAPSFRPVPLNFHKKKYASNFCKFIHNQKTYSHCQDGVGTKHF